MVNKWLVQNGLIYRLGRIETSPGHRGMLQNIDEINVAKVAGSQDMCERQGVAEKLAAMLNEAQEEPAGIPISFTLEEALNYYPITEKFRPLIEKVLKERDEIKGAYTADEDLQDDIELACLEIADLKIEIAQLKDRLKTLLR